jgi:hypothetical protein
MQRTIRGHEMTWLSAELESAQRLLRQLSEHFASHLAWTHPSIAQTGPQEETNKRGKRQTSSAADVAIKVQKPSQVR